MENMYVISEEIIIVGSRYGELADVVKPLYEKEEPIEENHIKTVLGGDEVYLSPCPNQHDGYAVGVYTMSQRLLGFVWMCQSPSVRDWIGQHEKSFVKAHITRIITKGGLMVARPVKPMKLEMRARDITSLDLDWADDLPDKYPPVLEQSLSLGIDLLKDALEEATEWTELLQLRIDKLLHVLPLDLSGRNYEQSVQLYTMMKQSPVAEIRQHGELLLSAFVNRGSETQMTWWAEKWLPDFLKRTGDDLLGLFEAAGYTLERVEKLLSSSPANLFYIYKADRKLFVNKLYYTALPQTLYSRLLTLLAVREAMMAKQGVEAAGFSQTKMAKAIEDCQAYFWGNSAYAVVFCLCRDDLHMDDSQTDFETWIESLPYSKERSYTCPEGTIANAFCHNDIYKYHVDKWHLHPSKSKKRIIKLRDELRIALK